jgi:hypothetical protein
MIYSITQKNDARYNSITTSIYFKTHLSEIFYPLAEMFLSEDNKKILPINIESQLSLDTLAFWICDDGQLVKRGNYFIY